MAQVLSPTESNLQLLATAIMGGEVVALATDTVFGLGCIMDSASAVERVFDIKGRELSNPLSVLVADIGDIDKVAHSISKHARVLIDNFMAGAITLVLKKSDTVPNVVTAGLGTVGVRVPDNDNLRALIRLVGSPIVLTSANLSKRVSAVRAEHVNKDIGDRIKYILDGRDSSCIESTIVDCSKSTPIITRQGAITQDSIQRALGVNVKVLQSAPNDAKRDRYNCSIVLVERSEHVVMDVLREYENAIAKGLRPVILCTDEYRDRYGDSNTYLMSATSAVYIRELYTVVRHLEAQYTAIIIEGIDSSDMDGVACTLVATLNRIASSVVKSKGSNSNKRGIPLAIPTKSVGRGERADVASKTGATAKSKVRSAKTKKSSTDDKKSNAGSSANDISNGVVPNASDASGSKVGANSHASGDSHASSMAGSSGNSTSIVGSSISSISSSIGGITSSVDSVNRLAGGIGSGVGDTRSTNSSASIADIGSASDTVYSGDNAASVAAAIGSREYSIMFVCTGNTCRSPMMEQIFRNFVKDRGLNVKVMSSGICASPYQTIAANAVVALGEMGIDCADRVAQIVDMDIINTIDLVVTMTEEHKKALPSAYNIISMSQISGKNVPDPYGGDIDEYRTVAMYLQYACQDIYDRLLQVAR